MEIKDSPNKLNITYVVHAMEKDTEHEDYFAWLADDLMANKQNANRTIIYCQTIKQCGIIYATIRGMIGPENMKAENVE